MSISHVADDSTVASEKKHAWLPNTPPDTTAASTNKRLLLSATARGTTIGTAIASIPQNELVIKVSPGIKQPAEFVR